MTNRWQYQISIYLGDEFAEVARRNPDDPAIAPLMDILAKHHATMKCQFACWLFQTQSTKPKSTS
jgi:hypothetical protein